MPEDLHTDSKYVFELGEVAVDYQDSSGEKSQMMVPVVDYVLSRLPKYKAQGPDGMRYEHIIAMPRELVTLITTYVLNGALPEPSHHAKPHQASPSLK